MKNIGILLICGIPASGKSTVAQILSNQDQSCEEGSSSARGICDVTGLSNKFFIHINYDWIINPDVEQKLISGKSGDLDDTWKAYRKNIIHCIDWYLSQIFKLSKTHIPKPETWRKFETMVPRLKYFLEEKPQNVVFIIDDNMYYRSMRYEYYQLARKYKIGYGQLYLKCAVDTALERNKLRDRQVKDDIIIGMDEKFEVPDINNSWEKHSLTVVNNTSDLSKVLHLVDRLLADPAQPVVEKDSREAECSRVQCSTNIIHQSDRILRKLVSDQIMTVKGSGDSKDDIKTVAMKVNEARNAILQMMRQGKIMVPEDFEMFQNSAEDTECPLFAFVKTLFNDTLK